MLETTAQIIVDEQQAMDGSIQLIPISQPMEIQDLPLEVMDVAPSGHSEEEITAEDPDTDLILEVNLDGKLLGAPEFDPAAAAHEEALVVTDEDSNKKDEEKADDSKDSKGKKSEKWDWESKGSKGFLSWVKERINDVPRHSGYDTAGLERAVSYLDRLDNEISKAMRLDLEGELDSNQIEHARAELEKGLDMLHDRIQKVKDSKKKKKGKKSANDQSNSLVKEAQKITGVQGIYVTVPLLISRVARVCINGMVSAGHDIEDLYARQVKKYKLTDREQAETMQLLADMGYALRQDRGFMPEDDLEVEDGMDWNQNFKG